MIPFFYDAVISSPATGHGCFAAFIVLTKMNRNDTLGRAKEHLSELLRFGIASYVIKERGERAQVLIDPTVQIEQCNFPSEGTFKDQDDVCARQIEPVDPTLQLLEQVLLYGEKIRAQVENENAKDEDEETELTMEIFEQEMESLKSHFMQDTTKILETLLNILTCWNQSEEWTRQQCAYDVLIQLYQHLWSSNCQDLQEKYQECLLFVLECGSLILDEKPSQVTLDNWFWYITSIEDMIHAVQRANISIARPIQEEILTLMSKIRQKIDQSNQEKEKDSDILFAWLQDLTTLSLIDEQDAIEEEEILWRV